MEDLDLETVVYSEKTTEGVKRNELVPSLIGGYAALVFENLLYSHADKLCYGYDGGLWEVVDLVNGDETVAFYFYPDFNGLIKVNSLGFQCDVETTAKAAGAAFTLMSLSQLSFLLQNKGKGNAAAATADVYHELRAFISCGNEFTAEEKTAIYKIID